jgi:protoheme IX farnesyltransferase
VAYGVEFTRLQILLYTILLVIVSVLPYITGMTGVIYLVTALALGAQFVRHAVALRRPDAPAHVSMRVFRFSVNYLMLLFAALLLDHFVLLRIATGP